MAKIIMAESMEEAWALAAMLGLEGVAMLLMGVRGGTNQYGRSCPLASGEEIETLGAVNLDVPGIIDVRLGTPFAALKPKVSYRGPGRDMFTYFRIVQLQEGDVVTVYGSGVAGLHVFESASFAVSALVSADEPQPEFPACAPQSLCAFPFPGPAPTPIAGAPAVPGPATAVLEIYERKTPEDADGFSSPTYHDRCAVARRVYSNKIRFV